MHHQVGGMRPSDTLFLRYIRRVPTGDFEDGGWVDPPTVWHNLGYSVRHTQWRCRVLWRSGFLERKTDDVVYRISDRGRKFLADEYTVSEVREFFDYPDGADGPVVDVD